VSERPSDERVLEAMRRAAELGGLEIDDYVLPTSRHVLAGTIRLHFLDWDAAPGAPDVVFLHGGGLTAHTWNLTCLALRPAYHCIAIDLRGHGDSEWSSRIDYSPDALLTDLEEFVDAIGLDRFALVGMSLGGLTALSYATRHAERLTGLVVVDTVPRVDDRAQTQRSNEARGGGRIRAFLAEEAELDSVEAFVQRALDFNPRRDPELLRVSLHNNLLQLPDGKWTWKYDQRHFVRFDFERLLEAIRTTAANVDRITCPCLIVRGSESDILTREAAAAFAETLPDGTWAEVPSSGHTVQGDNPRGLVEVLQPFLARVGSAVGPGASRT
jgi:pimeloyl-ACP methyl ester carboxylesterase